MGKTPLIHLARIHAYRSGIFQLFDVPTGEVDQKRKEQIANKKRNDLVAEGYVVVHTEYV